MKVEKEVVMMRFIAYVANRTVAIFAESDLDALMQARAFLGPEARVQAG